MASQKLEASMMSNYEEKVAPENVKAENKSKNEIEKQSS